MKSKKYTKNEMMEFSFEIAEEMRPGDEALFLGEGFTEDSNGFSVRNYNKIFSLPLWNRKFSEIIGSTLVVNTNGGAIWEEAEPFLFRNSQAIKENFGIEISEDQDEKTEQNDND